MIRYLKFATLFLIAIVFIAFAIANRESVQLSFFPLSYSAELPLFLLAIACIGVGALIASLVLSFQFAKARHRFSNERKRVAALENELAGLKAQRAVKPAATLAKS